MYARFSINLRQARWTAVDSDRRADPIRRAVVILFTVAVEATLVIGLILLTLAPGAEGGRGIGPDRPPAPLAAPLRP
jgi:hypothetical protein